MNKRKLETDFQLNEIFELENQDNLTESESDEIFSNLISQIGLMVIYFNSLDSLVSYAVDKALDPHERRSEINYLLISEMSYSQKVTFIIRNYGSLIYNDTNFESLKGDLESLEKNLRDSGTIRNIYAHADYGSLINGHYIKVKTKAKRNGVYHEYLRFEERDLEEDLNVIIKTRKQMENFEEIFWQKIFSN